MYSLKEGLGSFPTKVLEYLQSRGVVVKLNQPCQQLSFKDGLAMVRLFLAFVLVFIVIIDPVIGWHVASPPNDFVHTYTQVSNKNPPSRLPNFWFTLCMCLIGLHAKTLYTKPICGCCGFSHSEL